MSQNVPNILKQRIIEQEETSKTLIPNIYAKDDRSSTSEFYDNGRFLLRKGVETGLFYVSGCVSPGNLYVYDYKNGIENAKLVLEYKFGRTAIIADVLYFPLADDHQGIVVAVTDRSLEAHCDYLAYISLETNCLLKSFYLPYRVTTLHAILDGTAKRSEFLRLVPSFHTDWRHILLVGCSLGYVSLVNLDLDSNNDEQLSKGLLQNVKESPSGSNKKGNEEKIQPVRLKKNIHLSKIFYEDQMFVFRADDGTTRCHPKDKVSVSALHWLDKSGLAIVGFNFGGIMVVSLRNSKVYSMFYLDGLIQHFAFQEPEEDPRPILYFWISYNSHTIGSTLLLCTVNYPKDEQITKNSEEYTYLDPCFTPCMKWSPDSCTRLVTMRSICTRKNTQISNNESRNALLTNNESCGSSVPVKNDSSLLFISWMERNRQSEMKIHGAIFDLNAFYAKRLIPKIQPDSSIARQFPFLARFTSACPVKQNDQSRGAYNLLDMVSSAVSQFAPPAFLSETIDQLYYPSTYHLTIACLSGTKLFEAKVQPLQVQLISDLAQNIAKYFDSPHDPARWIHSIGLANSLPANNINEERACLLRVIVHGFFPGILSLIDSASDYPEWLKFIQKWLWKEVEITKAKFDDLCSPLFSIPPHEPSPSAKGFIQHARVFFKRASIVFEALNGKLSALAEHERSRSIVIQGRVARQVRLYSAGIAFALVYNLLPVNKLNTQLYEAVLEQFARRAEKSRRCRKSLEIHLIIDDIIKLNPDEEIWQGKTAQEWYPPRDFKSFLPILLMVNLTETVKLNLLGYYCLDLESASMTFGSNIAAKDGNTPPSSSAIRHIRSNSHIDDVLQPFRSQKYFSLFLSFFLQEDFTFEEMNRIRALWLEDERVPEQLAVGREENVSGPGGNTTEKGKQSKWLELGSSIDLSKCQKEYLKMEWGTYKFNELMLERKCYNFLMDLPPLKGNEPEFVRRVHAQCLDVKRRFPSLFKKTETLPSIIMQRYNDRVRQTQKSNAFALALRPQQAQGQPILPLNIKHRPSLLNESGNSEIMPQSDGKKAASSNAFRSPIRRNSDESEHYEELPLTIATPRKHQRLALFESAQPPTGTSLCITEKSAAAFPITSTCGAYQLAGRKSPVASTVVEKGLVKQKDWERISKVTQTPLSLRKSISQSRLPVRLDRPHQRDRTARTSLFPNASRRASADRDMPLSNGVTTPPTNDQRSSVNPNDQLSPESNIEPKTAHPPSILKSDKKQSRLPPLTNSGKPRLRFAPSLFTTEQIPSRIEKANDERHDTSFSNFASLSATESSASSTPALGSGNSTQLGSGEVTSLGSSVPPSAALGNRVQLQDQNRKEESGIGRAADEVPLLFDEPDKLKEQQQKLPSPTPTPEPEEEPPKSSYSAFAQADTVQIMDEMTAKTQEEEENEKEKEEVRAKAPAIGPRKDRKLEEEEELVASEGKEIREDGSEEEQTNQENSTTTNWLKANLRKGPLRRSSRARKVTEHFEPEQSPPRRSPSRLERTPSNKEKTPPIPQTPPSSRKRGRPPSAQKSSKPKSTPPPPSTTHQTPKKKGRPSTHKEGDA